MNDTRQRRIEALVERAAAVPASARAAFLERECAGDGALRDEVAARLASISGSRFTEDLRETVVDRAPAADLPEIEGYRLVRRIGGGGMGEVFEAEQREPVRRRVAVKVIRHGYDSGQVLQRFAIERQALAAMDHPTIARVYDAGLTRSGRPFFSMELISGPPITEHCDAKRLGTEERLRLFCRVCEGVFHAHLKGIVHRDLKPTNVLIREDDGTVTPKIIDFGVSKAVTSRAADETLFTEFGVLVGTPEYMSPEQARAGEIDVDLRSDVYSLGVLLYELLVGARPFDLRDMRRSGRDAMLRVILGTDPQSPSRRLTTLGASATELAARRSASPATLRRRLSGDLDWIAMKALEKDRARRYASPMALADDIRRHLAHEAIVARPPDALDSLRRFVRRHRVGVGVAAVALATLLAFTAVTWLQSRRIAAERDRANAEAATSQAVSRFLAGLFKESDPDTARGRERTAREILDRGAARVATELAEQPEVRARVMDSLGRVYREIGETDVSRELLEGALATRREILGNDAVETAYSMLSLANTYGRLGRLQDALALDRECIPVLERRLGPDHQNTLRAKTAYATRLEETGRFDEADAVLHAVLDVQRRTLGRDYHDALYTEVGLAQIDLRRGDVDRAVPALEDVLARLRVSRGSDHPNVLGLMILLAGSYRAQGRDDLAEPLLLEALTGRRKLYGDDGDGVREAARALAKLYDETGRPDEARALGTLRGSESR